MSVMSMKALMGFHEEWKVILNNWVGFVLWTPTNCSSVRYNVYKKECGWNIMANIGSKEWQRKKCQNLQWHLGNQSCNERCHSIT